MSSIFTKIIRGEIAGHVVAEDEDHLAFLDINPLVPGHTLVVPKVEVDYLFHLDDQALAALHVFSKKVAIAIEKAVPCLRIGVAVVGLEVPHCHIHLVPLNSMDDINFSRTKLNPSQVQLAAVAERISAHFQEGRETAT